MMKLTTDDYHLSQVRNQAVRGISQATCIGRLVKKPTIGDSGVNRRNVRFRPKANAWGDRKIQSTIAC